MSEVAKDPALYSFLFALIPVAAMAVGAVVAAARPPGERVRSAIQHFAAGVVFAVVAVELLPDIQRSHNVLEVAGGFALGVLVMLLVERWAQAHEYAEGGAEGAAAGILTAVGVDLVLDGLLLGIAFAAGATEGGLLAIALACEMLSLGLALTVQLTRAGASTARAILIPLGLAFVTLCGGAVLGSTALTAAPAWVMTVVLSFGGAALLFLVTEELLVEAHEVGETPWATAMFFLGFLVLLVLGMLG
ncbi:MAG TPA: transporter [Longimicrobiaceae bacterium]|nr:transporter [Longimicrobiaceae bacterium]